MSCRCSTRWTVFENYPVDPSQAAEWEGLTVENIQTVEQTNFPLNFIVGAADEVMLKIVYDQEIYSAVNDLPHAGSSVRITGRHAGKILMVW